MAEVYISGSIESADGFGDNQLSIRWQISCGGGWKVVSGESEGQTQTDCPAIFEQAYLGHPLDIHLSTNTIQGWPKILIQVWHHDNYGRQEIAGYGSLVLPSSSGSHQLKCGCWRPKGSWREEMMQKFVGGGMQPLVESKPLLLNRHTIREILESKKEDDEDMNISNILMSSASTSSPPSDSNITLWQFLLELLTQEKHSDIIQWTRSRDGEFKLIDAEAVARLWGQRKAKPHMNYDKLSRALRYYYEKNIIKKVIGQKFVYRFVTQETGADILKNVKVEDGEVKPFNSFGILNLTNGTSPASADTPSPSNSTSSRSSTISSSGASLMATTTHSTISPIPSTSSSPPTTVALTAPVSRKRPASPSGIKPPAATRRAKPNPLNLTATNNLLPPTLSPFMYLQQQQSSPFYPILNQLALASAGIYGAQLSPLLAANSPFRSPLSTPQDVAATTQPQVFQFPPTSTFSNVTTNSSLINPFAALISPLGPFMMTSPASTTFKFPSSESLKTPTVVKLP